MAVIASVELSFALIDAVGPLGVEPLAVAPMALPSAVAKSGLGSVQRTGAEVLVGAGRNVIS